MRPTCPRLLLASLLFASSTHAAPELTVDPITDTSLLAASAGFIFLSEAVLRAEEIDPQRPRPRVGVLRIDAWLARGDYQRDFVEQEDLAWISWASAAGLGAWALADALLLRDRSVDSGTDLVLYAESLTFSLAIAQLAKAGFRRPRPYTYLEGAPVHTDADSGLSFFSGHTAAASALAATATYFAFTRHDDPRLQAGVLAGGIVFAGTTGALRLLGRKHFLTDVLAGALVGGAVGLLVPHLHRTDGESTTTSQPAMLRLGGGF